MKPKPQKLRFWCKHCGFKTIQECLPDIDTMVPHPNPYKQGTFVPGWGLLWKCECCWRSVERTAYQASTGNQL